MEYCWIGIRKRERNGIMVFLKKAIEIEEIKENGLSKEDIITRYCPSSYVLENGRRCKNLGQEQCFECWNREMPNTEPKLRANPLMLPAIPVSFGPTVDIINDVFGDWNIAIPKDIIIEPIRNIQSGEPIPSVDKTNRATLTVHKPIKHNISEPILSDNCPLNGATTNIVMEYAIISIPVWAALSICTFCK